MRQSSPDPWQLLKQGVSLRTTLLAFVPIGLWIVFLVVFVYAFRAIVHLTGPAGTAMLVVRSMVEVVSAMIAFKYFFDILTRGAEREQSIDRERRA
jgi:hypothetical protein